MSFETRANIYLLTFLGSVIVGVTASVYFDGVQTQATRARIQWELQRERERHPETAPIKGFSKVTEAAAGELVSIDVHHDPKGVCGRMEPEFPEVCTQWVYGLDQGTILLRLRKCSDTVDTDCLRCTDINGDPLEYQKIVALDGSGKPIDFVGAQRLEQGWYLVPQPLRLTGRVTRIDGIGRFVEPILKIERVPTPE
jgi:hypothetical protein